MLAQMPLGGESRMGSRSATSSLCALFLAFIEQRTWSQAELARRIGLRASRVRELLLELQAAGVPLEREEEHPHVYWSVPRDWVPGGVVLAGDDVSEVLRLLSRLPWSKARDRLMARFMSIVGGPLPARNTTEQLGDEALRVLEDAALKRVAVLIDYLSSSTSARERRHVSVHHIEHGPRAHFIAVCHRDGGLKRFRVASVLRASLDREVSFRSADPNKLNEILEGSVNRFAAPGSPVTSSFVVRAPEARWVEHNLPEGPFQIEHLAGGAVRISARTLGLDVLARYVVGLGDRVEIETPELQRRVVEIARAILAKTERASSHLHSGDTDRVPPDLSRERRRPHHQGQS